MIWAWRKSICEFVSNRFCNVAAVLLLLPYRPQSLKSIVDPDEPRTIHTMSATRAKGDETSKRGSMAVNECGDDEVSRVRAGAVSEET
jgi:hypothetical protein